MTLNLISTHPETPLCRFSVPLLLKPLTQRGQRSAEPDRASLDFALGAVNRLLDAIGSEVVREAA